MNTTRQTQSCNRRQWLGIAVGALAAAPAWAGVEKVSGEHEPQPDLVRELSPDENEAAKSSRLVAHAQQLKRDGGYNCAELILTAAIKCYDLPQKTSDAAAAFGGGVGHGELCGFLTGASMAMGALAFKDGGERAQVKKRLKIWNDALWAWWKPLAPLNCRDLRPQYDKAGFEAMMVRVCLQVEKIVRIGRQPVTVTAPKAAGRRAGGITYPHERRGFAGDCVHAVQRHFVDAMPTGHAFESTGEACLKTVALVEACYRSTAENAVVDLRHQ